MSEQVKEVKDQAKSRKQMKKEAYAILKELVDKNPDQKYKNALATVRPSLYGVAKSSGPRVTAYDKFINFVKEKGSVSEDVVFKEFKIGRKDCAGYIRKHLKKTDPENRVWIAFDSEAGIYKVSGKGPNPPQNWKGAVPVDEKVEAKKPGLI